MAQHPSRERPTRCSSQEPPSLQPARPDNDQVMATLLGEAQQQHPSRAGDRNNAALEATALIRQHLAWAREPSASGQLLPSFTTDALLLLQRYVISVR